MSIIMLDLGMVFDRDGQPVSNEEVQWEKLIPNNHDYLFRFLEADLSKLHGLIGDYLGCLAERKQGNYDTLMAIHEELFQLHPYFKVFPQAVDAHLNRFFAGYIKYTYSSEGEEEMLRKLRLLVSAEYTPMPNLKAILDNATGEEESLFADLQRDLRRWVFVTIDNTNPAFAKMTTAQRNALYYLIDRNQFTPVLETGVQYSIRPTNRMRRMMAAFDFDMDTKYTGALWDLMDMVNHPTDEVPEGFQEVLDAVSDVTEDSSTMTYEIGDLQSLLSLELFDMSQKGLRIRRCDECGRYFMIGNEADRYCDRIPDGAEKSCKAMHSAPRVVSAPIARIVDTATANANAIQAAYRKAYKTHYARVKAGTLSEEAFTTWKGMAIKMKDTVAAGEMTLEAYEEWLKK